MPAAILKLFTAPLLTIPSISSFKALQIYGIVTLLLIPVFPSKILRLCLHYENLLFRSCCPSLSLSAFHSACGNSLNNRFLCKNIQYQYRYNCHHTRRQQKIPSVLRKLIIKIQLRQRDRIIFFFRDQHQGQHQIIPVANKIQHCQSPRNRFQKRKNDREKKRYPLQPSRNAHSSSSVGIP